MSDNTVVEKTIKSLNVKLANAINARGELESQLSAQSTLLINFIGKLSQTCKGINIQLDAKLAKLRISFKKSINLPELEKELLTISTLLQQHADLNDKNIKSVQEQLQTSVIHLKKLKSLPVTDRQQIKKLAYAIKENQDSIIQYVPIMSDFITFYDELLTSKNKQSSTSSFANDNINSAENITQSNNKATEDTLNTSDPAASKLILDRFNEILNTLATSGSHKTDISQIKSSLSNDISNQVLMTKCLKVFDFIIDDLTQERSSAKMFLSTLTETLVSVQASVKSTITSSTHSHIKHEEINKEINTKITEIGAGVNEAISLDDAKVDVNEKLIQIANTFRIKALLERQQREALQERLNSMSAHVDHLEQQGVVFEKRIKEQQIKSLTDALTKLNNRAAFDEYFAKEVVRFHHKPFELTVSVIDLDDFKRINDTYGHTAGDKTLQIVASTLTKVIGKEPFICRYGGEEFVIIFSNIDKVSVINKLNNLCKTIAKLPFTFKDTPVTITLSVGVTSMAKDDNIHSVFERADTALYQAKDDGKNRVVYG